MYCNEKRIGKEKKKLNKENIIILFSETCLGQNKKDPEKMKTFLIRFSKIPFQKIFLSSKEIHIDGIDTSFVVVVPEWKGKKFWEKCGKEFHCRNGTCSGCGRTSYGNYGSIVEQFLKINI